MLKKALPPVKRLVFLALFVALYVVCERFLSFTTWNMRIGFSFVPLAVAGVLLGPVLTGVVGAAGDLIGMVIYPTGPFFFGFTLNAFLTGFVFGFFLRRRQSFAAILSAILCTQLVLSLFLQTLWISITFGSPYAALLGTRLLQCCVMIPLEILVLSLLLRKQIAALLRKAEA